MVDGIYLVVIYTGKNGEKKSALFFKIRIFFSQNELFEKKVPNFGEKDRFKKKSLYFLQYTWDTL